MRRFLAATAAAALLAAAAPGRHALGQIPGGPAGPKFEIAEARGLAEVPARPDTGFVSSAPGPSFGPETKAVVVKFQASTPPKDGELSVVWIRQDGRTPRQLKSEPVPAGELASGAYAVLANDGRALAPGSYQVSVVGAGGRIYRTIQFTVAAAASGARPSLAAAGAPESDEGGGIAFSPYELEGLEFTYPSSYSAIPHTLTLEHGVTLVRQVPSSALLLVVRKSGRYDLRSEGPRYLTDISKDMASGGTVTIDSYDVREIGHANLGGHPATGRMIVARTSGSAIVQLTIYQTELFGKSTLVGYLTPVRKAGDAAGSLADPEQTAEDFFRLIQSIRQRAEAAPTKTEPPTRERSKPVEALDIASSRP